jgi:hypothetical protein
MRFSFRPPHSAESDLLGPLRELRSPVSTEAIKSYVLGRTTANFTLWSQLKSLIGEFLAIGVLTAISLNVSGFRNSDLSGIVTTVADVHTESIVTNSVNAAGTDHYLHSPSLRTRSAHYNILPSVSSSKIRTPEIADPITITNAPISGSALVTHPPSTPTQNNYLQPLPPYNTPSTSMEWFSTFSTGAVFSRIRMLGENAEIGIQSGWESIGLSFSNASGERDWHDIQNHHSAASSLLFNENDQAIALMAGANFPVGPLACSAELGPAFLFSSASYLDPATLTLTPGNSTSRFGIAAELSAFYTINGSLKAGITGLSTVQSGQFISGILISIDIRP